MALIMPASLYQNMIKMKKQILIVEDQISTRKLLSHYLGNFFEVVEKENVVEAMNWLKTGNKPDAIVTDILMPDVTGIEFLSQLKDTENDTTPVIMLSSIENSVEKLKCFNLGARDYLVKPFNPDELRIRINNLIKN